jgi:hypothetical protein
MALILSTIYINGLPELLMLFAHGPKYLLIFEGTARHITYRSIVEVICVGCICVALGFNMFSLELIALTILSIIKTVTLLISLIGFQRFGEVIVILQQVMNMHVILYLVMFAIGISGLISPFYLISHLLTLQQTSLNESTKHPLQSYAIRLLEPINDGLGTSGVNFYLHQNFQSKWLLCMLILTFLINCRIALSNSMIATVSATYATMKSKVYNLWLIELCNIMLRLEMQQDLIFPRIWKERNREERLSKYSTIYDNKRYFEMDIHSID